MSSVSVLALLVKAFIAFAYLLQLQRVEQEELRTREANQAALAALVGGRKRPRPDEGPSGAPSAFSSGKIGDAKSQVEF